MVVVLYCIQRGLDSRMECAVVCGRICVILEWWSVDELYGHGYMVAVRPYKDRCGVRRLAGGFVLSVCYVVQSTCTKLHGGLL